MILAVTGHRPPKLGGYVTPNNVYSAVVSQLRSAFEIMRRDNGLERVIIGMGLGVDQWSAQICIELGIPFIAAIPFNNFESRWPWRSKAEYERLVTMAERVEVVTPTNEYRPQLLQRRNEWMVDNCDQLLAVWNGSSGGTANCVSYAVRQRKPWFRLVLPAEIWEEARRVELRNAVPRDPVTLPQPARVVRATWEPADPPQAVRAPEGANHPARTPEEHLEDILGRFRVRRAQQTQERVSRPRPTISGEGTVSKTATAGEKRFQPARLIELDDET